MTQLEAHAGLTIYTLPWCPHCARAKALLRRRGLVYHEVDGTGVPDFRARLAALSGGFTVPQVLIDGEPIGGADRLAALDRLGVLAALAGDEQFPIVREVRRVSPSSFGRWAAARVRGRHGVPAASRTRVMLDRAGHVVGTDPVSDNDSSEEEHDGEGLCGTAG